MILVNINSCPENSKLAYPVYTKNGKIILQAGLILNRNYIDKINQLGIEYVYIEDENFSELEITDSLQISCRGEIIDSLKRLHKQIHTEITDKEFTILNLSKKLTDEIKFRKNKTLNILVSHNSQEYLFDHLINTAIITSHIAIKLGLNQNQLYDVVLAALIHDIGRKIVEEEKPEHVTLGFESLRKIRDFNLKSTIVCYEHHENFDGSGYPRKLKSDAISLFSRIVRVADLFDYHLYENGKKPKGISVKKVLDEMTKYSGSILDSEIFSSFIDIAIPYPNGSKVKLNSGQTAIVVKQNPNSPERPYVRVVENNKVLGDIYLEEDLRIYIEDTVNF